MTGLAAELLNILQSSTCYRAKQLFSLCTHEKSPYRLCRKGKEDGGGAGKEGRGGIRDRAFAFISGQMALAKVNLHLLYYISTVNKQVIR